MSDVATAILTQPMLINMPKQKECWINVYVTKDGRYLYANYYSKHTSDKCLSKYCHYRIHVRLK